MKIRSIFTLSLLLVVLVSCSEKYELTSYNQGINITPKPQNLVVNEGMFSLDNTTSFIVTDNKELKSVANFFTSKIKQSTGYDLIVTNDSQDKNFISISLNPELALNEEGYTLESTSEGVFY